MSRRLFLRDAAVLAVGTATLPLLSRLEVPVNVENPLDSYPSRDWEKVYRDQYRYDDSFTFVCAPNDTHMCRLRAFVRNGVLSRVEQNYDSGRYSDQLGNTASVHWNPRGCLKGMTVGRRIYGPYRLKGPVVREGWKRWADDGFPSLSDNPALRSKYLFDNRGQDHFTSLTWDEAYTYSAKGITALAETYSGDEGRRRLIEEDGYDEDMLEHWEGAGTRVLKMGSSLPVMGMIGKMAIFRFANMLALLDTHIRKVEPDHALGARGWSEYTWRGDQAPGMPFVHGLQGAEVDFNDLGNSRLHIQIGKNLVENKMPESHFFHDLLENGSKIVTITPEYSPPATKSDYWIPVRAGLADTALFLGITRALMEERKYDEAFVKNFSDLPLLVRVDNLRRLSASDVIPNYRLGLRSDGPSFALQNLTQDQYQRLGDFMVYDADSRNLKPITRDHVGARLAAEGVNPDLNYRGTVTLTNGQRVEVMTTWEMYREHLKDYDLETVSEITGASQELIRRLIDDIATTKPIAIHFGEGINHYFHATLATRAFHLPLILTGNIGQPGAGCYTWAGNYKGAVFQAIPGSGTGAASYQAEDPFNPVLDPSAQVTADRIRRTKHDEEPAYWAMGDRPLIVDTPAGRKNFTGKSHMPTPTKLVWYSNANLLNVAKWHYDIIKNVNPKVDMIIDQQIEWTGSAEYADMILPVNSWLESQSLEVASSCSNPFLQIWGGNGIKPLYDTQDDAMVFARIAEKLGQQLSDPRFANYWKFILEGRNDVYIQRLLDGSAPTKGYKLSDILAGKYGEPGAALMQYRTYPRIPFYEQVHDSIPFYTDTGRLNTYVDLPEAIEYGENLVVHREAVEATPYLPNVIVSTSPYVRPNDYGIAADDDDADMRQVRNLKLPWSEVKNTVNPLIKQGYSFYCLTPKQRHSVHSSWAVTDWNAIWASNFGDPRRLDKRQPGTGEWQLHMNPQAAKDLEIADGDYVYVDANEADRPYRGWKKSDPFYKVARCLLRVKYNPAYPYNISMMKHGAWMATERSVLAHEKRKDGRAVADETGYQASFRYGSQQSITRGWAPPMHQLDSLFHKAMGSMTFIFGYEEDNHAVNTVPKETLVRIVRAEAGGLGGKGVWAPATTGYSPGGERAAMNAYLEGRLMKVDEA
jgi:nitrate reductase alpha subunit